MSFLSALKAFHPRRSSSRFVASGSLLGVRNPKLGFWSVLSNIHWFSCSGIDSGSASGGGCMCERRGVMFLRRVGGNGLEALFEVVEANDFFFVGGVRGWYCVVVYLLQEADGSFSFDEVDEVGVIIAVTSSSG